METSIKFDTYNVQQAFSMHTADYCIIIIIQSYVLTVVEALTSMQKYGLEYAISFATEQWYAFHQLDCLNMSYIFGVTSCKARWL